MSGVSIAEVRKSFEERPAGGSSNFDGVRIDFIKLPEGKTRLLFLSDLEWVEDNPLGLENNVPHARFYRYYKPAPNGTYNNKPAYMQNDRPVFEFVYNEEDPFEPGFVKERQENNKSLNPDYFPIKGLAYILNLTALKAVSIYLEKGSVTLKDFNRNPDETKAAKDYIKQYELAKKNHAELRQRLLNNKDEPKDIGDFVWHGIYIYNFGVSISKEISNFIETLEADGIDQEEIRLGEYVFALGKSGEGIETRYSFTVDFPSDEIDPDLVAPAIGFLANNDELSDFENLIDRKRFKGDDDDLEEEYKVSNVVEEEKQEVGSW